MFTKGNTYGKGRPAGSQNKLTKTSKDFLKSVLFNEAEFLNDFKELDVNGRMELRIKLASYVLPKATWYFFFYPCKTSMIFNFCTNCY